MPGRRDAITQNMFRVEIDGLSLSNVQSVEMLETTTAVIEYRDGVDALTRKLMGANAYGDIVLSRGWTGDRELWNWRRAIVDGQPDRRSGAIVVLDRSLAEVGRFLFFDGWPRRWRIGPWHGALDGALIESIDLAVERIDLT